MKLSWLIVNVVSIVVAAVLIMLMIESDGMNPIMILLKSSPNLILRHIANAAGIYILALLFGLLGILYKANRKLGYTLASWVGLFLMIFVSIPR